MKLQIISPERINFEGEVRRVTLPGTEGQFTVLDHHAPLIATLSAGKISYDNGADTSDFPIKGGIVEVCSNRVIVTVY